MTTNQKQYYKTGAAVHDVTDWNCWSWLI